MNRILKFSVTVLLTPIVALLAIGSLVGIIFIGMFSAIIIEFLKLIKKEHNGS
jgi:hypothetical protein